MSLIKANVDPTIKIKEQDADSIHIEFTHNTPVNDGLADPIKTKSVQIFTREEWAAHKRAFDKFGLGIANWHELRMVHDPDKKEPKTPGRKPATSKSN